MANPGGLTVPSALEPINLPSQARPSISIGKRQRSQAVSDALAATDRLWAQGKLAPPDLDVERISKKHEDLVNELEERRATKWRYRLDVEILREEVELLSRHREERQRRLESLFAENQSLINALATGTHAVHTNTYAYKLHELALQYVEIHRNYVSRANPSTQDTFADSETKDPGSRPSSTQHEPSIPGSENDTLATDSEIPSIVTILSTTPTPVSGSLRVSIAPPPRSDNLLLPEVPLLRLPTRGKR
ncbi:hypothetical protein BJ742DRAFT_819841 [Cladochytrium replicatum]|nr:hypothetical protein BJ742DRAFT_819841 [Cladochytrium replicatum]